MTAWNSSPSSGQLQTLGDTPAVMNGMLLDIFEPLQEQRLDVIEDSWRCSPAVPSSSRSWRTEATECMLVLTLVSS